MAVVLVASWAPSVTGMPVPGPSISPQAGVAGGQIAVGEFFSPLPKGKDGFSAFFLVVGRVAQGSPEYSDAGTYMFLAGETCRVVRVKAKKSKDGKKAKKGEEQRLRHTLDCDRFQHEGEVPPTDFQMDPLLMTAHLKTNVDGSEVDVTWTGKGDLPTGVTGLGFYGGAAVDGGAFAERWASAEGTIFGHPVRSAEEEFCFSFSALLEGALGYAYAGDLFDGLQVPRRASEVSSEGVRSGACSSRI
jgi:hypothetical protein